MGKPAVPPGHAFGPRITTFRVHCFSECYDITVRITASVQDPFEAGLRQRRAVSCQDTEVVRRPLPGAQVITRIRAETGVPIREGVISDGEQGCIVGVAPMSKVKTSW